MRVHATLLCALALGSGAPSAWAQVPRSGERTEVEQLQDALLEEAAHGNPAEAIKIYERILREQALDHPVRVAAVYRLAVLRYELGDIAAARSTLVEGIRTGACTAVACYTLLGQITLEEASIRELPVRWTFSDNDHGLLHPWEYDDMGSIRVQARDEAANPALIWRTTVDVRKDDRLVVGFDAPTPVPRRISFYIQAENRDSTVRARVIDDLGRSYFAPSGAILVRAERPTEVVLDLARLVPADPEDPPFDPASIRRLSLEDVSALNGTPPGPHALYLDNFTIE